MAVLPITASVVSPGKGPYTYSLTANNACSDVKFIYGQQEGLGSIQVGSDDPAVSLMLEFDEEKCRLSDIIASISLVVNNGECVSKFALDYKNPCKDFRIAVCPLPPHKGKQDFVAQVSGGNGPFTYEWTTKNDSVFVQEGECNQKVVINREGTDTSFNLCVKATDCNGCTAETEINVPKIKGEKPVIKPYEVTRNCDDPKTKSYYIDVLKLTTDVDGTIDLSSIQIVTHPACGTVSVDYASGIITYAGDNGCAGKQIGEYRVQDNNGNWSNLGRFCINLDPCAQDPIAVNDTITIACEDKAVVNLLNNDFAPNAAIDIDSLEIINQPINGTLTTFSDGNVEYCPNPGFRGIEIIRYRFYDEACNASGIASFIVIVESCCDDHTAGLDIGCSETTDGEQICFTSANTGFIDQVTGDEILFDIGDGFTPGSNVCLPKGDCAPSVDTWVNLSFTDNSGNIPITSGSVGVNPLGNNTYNIQFNLGSNIPTNLLSEMIEYINSCSGVIQIGPLSTTIPYSFLSSNISGLVETTQGFSFNYNPALAVVSECADEVFQQISITNGILIGIESDKVFLFSNDLSLRCITFSENGCIFFKRIVTREDPCNDVHLVFKVSYNVNSGCSSLEVVQTEGPIPPPTDTTNNFDTCLEGPAEIQQVYVSGNNILTSSYSIGDITEMNNFLTYLNNYLMNNGGGFATQAYDTISNKLIIQIQNSTLNFTSVGLTGSNGPFTVPFTVL